LSIAIVAFQFYPRSTWSRRHTKKCVTRFSFNSIQDQLNFFRVWKATEVLTFNSIQDQRLVCRCGRLRGKQLFQFYPRSTQLSLNLTNPLSLYFQFYPRSTNHNDIVE